MTRAENYMTKIIVLHVDDRCLVQVQQLVIELNGINLSHKPRQRRSDQQAGPSKEVGYLLQVNAPHTQDTGSARAPLCACVCVCVCVWGCVCVCVLVGECVCVRELF